MFDEIFDTITKKTLKKSGETVKKEVKTQVQQKIDKATTGKNGQKLLIASLILSGAALLVGLCRTSKPVIVNVYNN